MRLFFVSFVFFAVKKDSYKFSGISVAHVSFLAGCYNENDAKSNRNEATMGI